ncbi:hypothetical protein [Candidatus Burkholderia verschuerenii]|uniref:hypothetical protein n=1 Tax=Candidatus Burkholderia verschuerenii TaxID=242163 RepID=UPI000A766E0F|nr:hypothetical protein [Candidatus Burkholderia verschuerenii]
MSVRDVETIDYIGVNILFRKVYVGIFDELDWQDEAKHQELLSRACKIEFAGMDPTTQSGADVNAHLSQVCSARVEVEA